MGDENEAFEEPVLSEEDMESCKEMGVEEEEARKLLKEFKRFDMDGSNYIDNDEILHVWQCIGQNPSMEEAEQLMLESDKDEDGRISFTEFVRLIKDKRKTPDEQEQELKEAFEALDEEGNGYLDKEQLRDALCQFGESMTDEEVEKMFELGDIDEDGKIQYEEFIKLFIHDKKEEHEANEEDEEEED